MKKAKKKAAAHSPTLRTIRMVEKALKDSEYGTLKVPELKRALPKKIQHNTLLEIIDYLDKSNKVYVGVKGVTWIYNPSKKLQRAIDKAITWEELEKKLHLEEILAKKYSKKFGYK